MKNIATLFFLLALLFFPSCQSGEPSGSPVQNVILDLNHDQKLFLSEIADSIEIIPLEHTDESDIQLVWRLVTYKDRYYFYNGIGSDETNLLVFDRVGNFIYRLDKRGQGPGEYLQLNDIAIDRKREELLLLTARHGVYRYDLDGRFIDRNRLSTHGDYIATDSVGNIYQTTYCNDDNANSLLFITQTDSSYFHPVDKGDFVRLNQHSHSNFFDLHNGNVYYSAPYCDSIFTLTNGIKEPFLYINYNGKNFPTKDVFFPNNTYVFKGFNTPRAVEDGWLLWFVRPSWLLRGYNTYKKNVSPEKWEAFCKRYPKMVEVCLQLDEESNPVLFRIKVKDF